MSNANLEFVYKDQQDKFNKDAILRTRIDALNMEYPNNWVNFISDTNTPNVVKFDVGHIYRNYPEEMQIKMSQMLINVFGGNSG